MPSLELILAALWWGPLLLLFRLWDRRPSIAESAPVEDVPLSVIVPARNEGKTIATLLNSLRQSSYRPLEIVVVDDRSTDDTAAVVKEHARNDDRIVVVDGVELPDGWFGKPWACYQGYRAASGEILVFTDADTRHEPALLAHAVGALGERSADLVTVAPHQVCVGFWERVIMPQVWAILGVRYHPRAINASRSPQSVIANGQFIMMPRASYEAIGTHETVKEAVAEDLALAQRTVECGGRIFFGFATELMETRMYTSLPELIEGWSKNLYLGGQQALKNNRLQRFLFPFFFPLMAVYWVLPPTVLTAGLATGNEQSLLAGAVATTGSVVFWVGVSVGMRIPAWYGLLYPLGVVMLAYIAGRSISRGSRRVEWRGRVYGGGGGGSGGGGGGFGTSA